MSTPNELLESMEEWVNIYVFRSLTGFFDQLKISGLSLQQVYVLTFIYYQGPSNISRICERMMVSAPAVSQMADRLEKQNLVSRKFIPGDRRVRVVELSPKGEKLVKQSIAARQSWMKEIPSALNEKQRKQISDAFQTLISISKKKSKNTNKDV
jgi:DNA-binding MarR family transcriptional regulator